MAMSSLTLLGVKAPLALPSIGAFRSRRSSRLLAVALAQQNGMLSLMYRKGQVYDYAVSVPWRKVRQSDEVILAWKMNGVDLPKIHGYPLRVVGRVISEREVASG